LLDSRSIRMFVVRGARTIKQTRHFRLKKGFCFIDFFFFFFFVSTCETNVQGDQL
jgi:hypothetical protein